MELTVGNEKFTSSKNDFITKTIKDFSSGDNITCVAWNIFGNQSERVVFNLNFCRQIVCNADIETNSIFRPEYPNMPMKLIYALIPVTLLGALMYVKVIRKYPMAHELFLKCGALL